MSCLCVSVLQSGRLWARWSGAASSSSYFWGSAGASVVLTPAAATSPAAAVPTPAAVHDTVSKECSRCLLYTGHFSKRFIVVLFSCCSVYEAGKMAKRGPPAPVPVYPYYVPGVHTVVPVAPSSHTDPKITSLPSVETNMAGGESG